MRTRIMQDRPRWRKAEDISGGALTVIGYSSGWVDKITPITIWVVDGASIRALHPHVS